MKKRTSELFKYIVFALVIMAVSCARPSQSIIIISTNDIHSGIDGFPSLATLVEDYRREFPGSVLLVDAGDRWTGNPYVDLAAEPGKPVIDLMNTLGYDIATFGNHEFDNGIDHLSKRTGEAEFRKILANAVLSDTPIRDVRPFEIVSICGIDIAIFGLVTNAVNGHPDGKDENFEGAIFFDPIETSLSLRDLRNKADVFVALTHTGLDKDIELAEKMSELDLIIGGHSHDTLHRGMSVNDVLITQTGKNLKYAGVTRIDIRGEKIHSIQNKLVWLDTIPPSPEIAEKVREIYGYPGMKVQVGENATELNKIGLMNVFSDILREQTGAQFAFYNLGSMRIDKLPAGPVTRGDVYAAEPFYNSPFIVEMSHEDMQRLILDKFNSSGKESHTLDIYPSGLTYKIITDGEGNGTDVFFTHNYYPETGKLYTVAMSDYMYEQYDFPHQKPGVPTGRLMTDYVFDYMAKHKPLQFSNESRVSID